MYAKLVYNAVAGNDPEQVLADITLLLTGTTDIASLGGDIDSGSSEIDVAYHTPAYVLHDDVSATQKVFKIPVHDDGTSFFYFELFSTGNDIDMKLWEDWTIGGSGSGQAYYTSTGFEFVSMDSYSTYGMTFYFTITAKHCLARSEHSTSAVEYARGFIQYERRELWDTVANGSKPVVITYRDYWFSTTAGIYALPHKRSDGSTYSSSNAQLHPATAYGNSQYDNMYSLLGNSSGAARGLDASESSIHNMYEFGFSYLSTGERFLTGKVADMYYTTYGDGAFGDTVSVDSNPYIIWEASLDYRVAIRKG
jgi:hypothetical protein